MYKEHPVFEKPENENALIWRYMDFTKFISLLDKSSLFFARSDKLDDPFEGSYSKANVRLRPEVYKDIPQDMLKKISSYFEVIRRFTLINCWHLGEYESAAMWRLYLKSNEGIAVRSTFNLLKDCFQSEEQDVYIGKVKYIDYETEWMPEGNTFYPFVHKRKSFEHERELRAIIQKIGIKEDKTLDTSTPLFRQGAYIPVNLSRLIDKIYIAPTSPEWLGDLIRSVIEKYGLDKQVVQSSLDEAPVY